MRMMMMMMHILETMLSPRGRDGHVGGRIQVRIQHTNHCQILLTQKTVAQKEYCIMLFDHRLYLRVHEGLVTLEGVPRWLGGGGGEMRSRNQNPRRGEIGGQTFLDVVPVARPRRIPPKVVISSSGWWWWCSGCRHRWWWRWIVTVVPLVLLFLLHDGKPCNGCYTR